MMEIGGPRGSTIVPDDFDWYLLIGDQTALPAIGRRVETLRAGAAAKTIIVVDNVREQQEFQTAAHWWPLWCHRRGQSVDDATLLIRALQRFEMPAGDGFVWIAGEASAARAVRAYMLEVKNHPLAWLKASGYWVKGRAGAHEKLDAPGPGGRLAAPDHQHGVPA